MLASSAAQTRPGTRSIAESLDVATTAEEAFALICSVSKWPVWLAFVRSAQLAEPTEAIGLGSEVVVRSLLPGEPQELYEVDAFISNYHLSLVGAYSVRRRIDFRVEAKLTRAANGGAAARSRIHVRVEYPAYGGRLGALYDSLTAGRRLSACLADSLAQFKGLVEFENRKDALLADF